jgi:Pyridoxamine 5'-phosphate oxidase
MSRPPAAVIAEIHGFSDPDAIPTPWAEGLREVIAADTFWLWTVRADGRPHVTPLIGVWHGDAIWFSIGAGERKARNLAENSSCVLTTGRSDLCAGARSRHSVTDVVWFVGITQNWSLKPASPSQIALPGAIRARSISPPRARAISIRSRAECTAAGRARPTAISSASSAA